MSQKFVIVGGDAAGMSAASKAKRDAPEMEVVVLERGDWVSYGACGLPYYVKGEIAELDDLVVLDPRRIVERGIDLRRHHQVTTVDREGRTLTVETDEETYEESYDVLLLATGGRATGPDVPGADLEGIFSIRSLETGRALRHYIAPHDNPPAPAVATSHGETVRSHLDEPDVETVGVVGANKIGIELAEAFVERGMDVHIFHADSRVLPAFGADIADVVESHLRDRDVELHLEIGVEAFQGQNGRVTAVETTDGTVPVGAVVTDLVIEPNVDLAADASIELGPSGAIATDEYGVTSDPAIYAAGDCAAKRHLLTGDQIHWPYALAANRAGRAIGRTVAGRSTPIGGVVGTLTMKAFDLQVARTGLVDESAARDAGFDPVSSTVTTISRAHYYPGWSRIGVHGVADRETGRLLGVNMVGEEGVAHRVNAVATALAAGMTVWDVGNLDFGYTPPFGPVWDPVLGAAKILGEAVSPAGTDDAD